MTEPFVAELRIISFNFAPKGWAFCNGQLLPINQNQALFSLLGTTYGGNGVTTFALPDLRGAAGMHVSAAHSLGERAGEETHLLASAELAYHAHTIRASTATGSTANPVNKVWATNRTVSLYTKTSNTVVGADAFQPAGGSQAHENMPPYLVLNVIIALFGVFPSRN